MPGDSTLSLPNIISLGRLLAVPLAVWLILDGELGWAFWLFVAAAVSDAIDGIIARLWHAQTVLGGYLDPLADKALLVSVYLTLGQQGYLPVWLVILVVFRDIMIVGGVLLLYFLKESFAMQPLFISKFNTLAQIALAGTVLAVHGLGLVVPAVFGVPGLTALFWVIAGSTILSGIGYMIQAGQLFRRHGGVA